MTTPKLIAITGKKRHGKNTVANIIAEHLNSLDKPNHIHAFADDLKEACAAMLGVNTQELDGANKEVFRPFIQWYGTDYIRKYRGMEDYWINKTAHKIAHTQITDRGMSYSIITDCRFPGEADWVRRNNGIIIRVFNPRIPDDKNSAHSSEQAEFEVDHTLTNDSTLRDLQILTESYLKELGFS